MYPLEMFTNEFIKAINTKTMNDFKKNTGRQMCL